MAISYGYVCKSCGEVNYFKVCKKCGTKKA